MLNITDLKQSVNFLLKNTELHSCARGTHDDTGLQGYLVPLLLSKDAVGTN